MNKKNIITAIGSVAIFTAAAAIAYHVCGKQTRKVNAMKDQTTADLEQVNKELDELMSAIKENRSIIEKTIKQTEQTLAEVGIEVEPVMPETTFEENWVNAFTEGKSAPAFLELCVTVAVQYEDDISFEENSYVSAAITKATNVICDEHIHLPKELMSEWCTSVAKAIYDDAALRLAFMESTPSTVLTVIDQLNDKFDINHWVLAA